MLYYLVYSVLFSSSITLSAPSSRHTSEGKNNVECSQNGDCLSDSTHCEETCGCNGLYFYNATINECQIDQEYIKQLMVEKYNTEEKITVDAEKVFNGIIVAVLFFITCASICAATACIYCCHINYTDQKLSGDVNALANKLKRDNIILDPSKATKKSPKPSGESCTIVDADAGVFVC